MRSLLVFTGLASRARIFAYHSRAGWDGKDRRRAALGRTYGLAVRTIGNPQKTANRAGHNAMQH
jgi:hypothetical protein